MPNRNGQEEQGLAGGNTPARTPALHSLAEDLARLVGELVEAWPDLPIDARLHLRKTFQFLRSEAAARWPGENLALHPRRAKGGEQTLPPAVRYFGR